MWVISADTYQHIMKESAVVANFTNEIMATRFSEVMAHGADYVEKL